MLPKNNWNVSYSTISFFENALKGHDKVKNFVRRSDINFFIEHVDGSTLNVLLVNEYSLGLAAIFRAKAEFPEIDYVVTGGAWNGYTPEAKEHGMRNNIGVFNSNEFLGALNLKSPKNYHRKDRDGNPIYAYKSS